MLPKSSCLQAPIIVKESSKTTNRNEIEDLDPTAKDKNNNDRVERANTVLKANNILGVHVLEEKEGWLYKCADNYNVCNSDSPTYLRKEWRWEAPTHLLVILMFSTLPKPKITGSQKQELWVKYLRQISLIFYIGKCKFIL